MSLDGTADLEWSDDETSPMLNEPWMEISVSMHGPYSVGNNQRKRIACLRDNTSGWISARIFPDDSDVGQSAGDFIFEQLCTFGFAKCSLAKNEFANPMIRRLVELWETTLASAKDLKFENFISIYDDDENNTEEIFQGLVDEFGYEWDYYFNSFLFRIRCQSKKNSCSPFKAMFRREPISPLPRNCSQYGLRKPSKKRKRLVEAHSSDNEEELEEEFHNLKRRKKSKKSNGIDYSSRREKLVNSDTKTVSNNKIDEKEVKLIQEATVSSIKALLTATRDERMRRGKYIKYDPDLKDEIAEYALENGVPSASEYYSGKLDAPVTQSTVRNFVKSYNLVPNEVKEEIGKHVYLFGMKSCLQKYQNKMINQTILEKNVIKRCHEFYTRRNPDLPEDDDIGSNTNKSRVPFSQELRDEIGCHAAHNSIVDTIKVYTDKLQLPMKESTVRKFKKAWLDKNQVKEQQNQIVPVNAPISFVQQPQPGSTQTTILSHPGSGAQIGQIPSQSEQIVVSEPPKFAFVSQGNSNNQPLSLTINTINNTKKPGNCGEEENVESKSINLSKKGKLKVPRKSIRKGPKLKQPKNFRGSYATYGPDMRAKIGGYALDHGNQETVNYFLEQHGIDVPESTVRGLRDKFILKMEKAKKEKEDLDRLDYGPRGRPVSLGKYDQVVKKILLELVKAGEKMSSFLAIATAKKVLMEHEPDMLVENGGNVKLNPIWAKSFIRRMKMKSVGGK